MGFPFIVLGDTTSHGGTVISAAPTTDTGGIRIARMGDMVSCPKCKGVFPIAEGDRSLTIEGAPAAYHGCKTTCGATLIAGQSASTLQPSGGPGAGAGLGAAANAAASSAASAIAAQLGASVGSIGNGLLAGYEDEILDEVEERYRGRFLVFDAKTGEPIAGQTVRLRSTGGQYLSGITDEDGCTEWIEREVGEALACDLEESA